MAPRRRRVRVLLVLVIAVLLWILLELNRFLPGSWPGGGGDTGSRPMPAGSEADPGRLRPDERPPAPVVPKGPVLRVVLGEPPGSAGGPAKVTARAGERAATATFGGSATTLEGIAPEQVDDLIVERYGRRLVHGPFPRGTGADVGVAWPRAPLPPPTVRAPGPVALRVTDEAGAPVVGAEVHVTGRPGGDALGRTDADGRVGIALPQAGRVRICASADGFGEACIDASVRSAEPLEIRLPRMERRRARLVDPETGEPLRATTVRLIGSDGMARDLPAPEGGFEQVDVTWPRTRLTGGSVEVEVAGRPMVRAPLDALGETLPVPGGRTVEVTVSMPAGEAVGSVPVTVRWAPAGGVEPGEADLLTTRTATDAEGRVRVAIPRGRAAELLVEPGNAAPAGLSIPAEGTASIAAPLTTGIALKVRVETADGKPVAGANVVALARAGNATVRRRALSADDGTATLPPVAEGRLEVYARRAGYAWAVAAVEARPGVGATRLVLSRGHRLRLVVEDTEGLPLPGVAVRSVARADATSGAPDPGDPDGVPWTTDADGVLVVEDLPDREVDLYLGRAGYEEEVVARVRPGAITWFATLVRSKR